MFIIDAHQMRSDRPAVFSTWGVKYYPSVDMHEPEPEKAIKDFVNVKQEEQIERRQPEDAKGFAELDTFYTESNKAGLEHKASAWASERIYCEKDGGIAEECGSSIPYLFIVDCDNDADGYEAVDYQIPKDGDYYSQSSKELFAPSERRQIEDFDMSNEIKKPIFKVEEAEDSHCGIH